jgi:hypothetical protein
MGGGDLARWKRIVSRLVTVCWRAPPHRAHRIARDGGRDMIDFGGDATGTTGGPNTGVRIDARCRRRGSR